MWRAALKGKWTARLSCSIPNTWTKFGYGRTNTGCLSPNWIQGYMYTLGRRGLRVSNSPVSSWWETVFPDMSASHCLGTSAWEWRQWAAGSLAWATALNSLSSGGDWRIGNTKTWQLQITYITCITTFAFRPPKWVFRTLELKNVRKGYRENLSFLVVWKKNRHGGEMCKKKNCPRISLTVFFFKAGKVQEIFELWFFFKPFLPHVLDSVIFRPLKIIGSLYTPSRHFSAPGLWKLI